jgi:hypothetical protein
MNMTLRIGLAALAGACCLGPVVRAAEGEGPAPYRWGVELLAAMPRQDFKGIDSRTGLGLGVFAENQLGSGVTLQTRFEFIRFPQTNSPQAAGIASWTAPDPLTLSADSAALGVDLRKGLALPGLPGAFVLAGLHIARYEFETSAASDVATGSGLYRYKDKTPFQLGFELGIGTSFSPDWALALRYTTVTIQSNSFATVETSLSYRF